MRKAETRRKGSEQQRRRDRNRQSSVQREEREKANRKAAGERSYIGSTCMRGARGEGSHAHTKRDAHLAPLKPLVELLARAVA